MQAVLDEVALRLSTTDESLIRIPDICEATGVNYGSVYHHFGSREELQVAVVRTYHEHFKNLVFIPALLKPKGLPRLKKLIDAWLRMSIGGDTSSCFFIAGAAEYDDRPGIVREELIRSVETWRAAITRSIEESIAAGHLKKNTDVDALLFQLYSIVLGAHHDARFLDNPKSLKTANALIKEIFNRYQASK